MDSSQLGQIAKKFDRLPTFLRLTFAVGRNPNLGSQIQNDQSVFSVQSNSNSDERSLYRSRFCRSEILLQTILWYHSNHELTYGRMDPYGLRGCLRKHIIARRCRWFETNHNTNANNYVEKHAGQGWLGQCLLGMVFAAYHVDLTKQIPYMTLFELIEGDQGRYDTRTFFQNRINLGVSNNDWLTNKWQHKRLVVVWRGFDVFGRSINCHTDKCNCCSWIRWMAVQKWLIAAKDYDELLSLLLNGHTQEKNNWETLIAVCEKIKRDAILQPIQTNGYGKRLVLKVVFCLNRHERTPNSWLNKLSSTPITQ